MLRAARKDFLLWAEILNKETGIKYDTEGREVIQQMADGYCLAKDTGDERKKNMYISGLMLRFWYAINKIKEKSPVQGLDYTDFMAWLHEAIEYACKYRAWQDPARKVNAQQAINQCIETIRMQKYYSFNLQKNKANFNTMSLEVPAEEDGKATLLDTLVDEDAAEKARIAKGANAAICLIQDHIDKNKIVEAIILDTIAFNDTQKVTKTVVQYINEDGEEQKRTQRTSEFYPFRCVQALNNLPDNYIAYFCKQYKVGEKELEAAVNTIRKANNKKLYSFIDSTLIGARAAFN